MDGGSGVKSCSGGEEEEDGDKEQCEEEEGGYSVRLIVGNHVPSLSIGQCHASPSFFPSIQCLNIL